MPVHRVPGGYQWGNHGRVYKTKEQAEAQGRAAYANGYREDSARRAARRKAAKALTASKRAETRYVLDLQKIMGAVHKGVMKFIYREHLTLPFRQDTDPPTGLGDGLLRKMFRFIEPQVQKSFDRMADTVEQASDQAHKKLLGIAPSSVAGVASTIIHARRDNVELIKNASKDFLDGVRGVLQDNEGERVETIAQKLRERVGVSNSRAQLIARDQTLKLNSQITQHRQRAAGVRKYTWSGSLDQRERPMHLALEGQVFLWDQPPVTNEDGDRNHPGEDYQCRCVALPYIDELAEEPSEERVPEAPAYREPLAAE